MTSAHRLRALIVEDEPLVRVLAKDALVRAGFDVDEETDGLQALARLETDRAYDIIFVDLGLLGARGEIVLAKAVASRPDVPIVAVTGEPVRPELLPKQAVVLAKPFKPKELVRLANRLLDVRRAP